MYRIPVNRRTAPVISRKASSDPSSWASEFRERVPHDPAKPQHPRSEFQDPRSWAPPSRRHTWWRSDERVSSVREPWASAVQFSNSEDPRSDTTMAGPWAGRFARSDTSRAYIREVAFRSALRARLLRSEGAAAKVRRVCWDPESETPGGRSALSAQWVRSLRVVHLSSEDPMTPTLPSEQVIIYA